MNLLVRIDAEFSYRVCKFKKYDIYNFVCYNALNYMRTKEEYMRDYING